MKHLPIIDALHTHLNSYGMRVFGALAIESDEVPNLVSTSSPLTAILIGNAGPDMWNVLVEGFDDGQDLSALDDPMDTWTRRIIEKTYHAIASDLPHMVDNKPIQVVFPFDGPPHYPFQKWAIRTGEFYVSPIGPLIHHEFGLWAGFRAAIICEHEATEERQDEKPGSPCESCSEKPCLSTCPVNAFGAEGYDVPACSTYLKTSDGVECMAGGCQARRACPVGDAYRQTPAQAQFHISKFLTARG